MPQFKYSAMGADGKSVRGRTEALSASGLENELLIEGLSNIRVRERIPLTQIEITRERVPRQDVMHFSRQLSAFVRAGIPITEAIRIVADGVTNKRFQATLDSIEESLQSGLPLAAAVGQHASVFPSYYVSILRSAEMTGQLDVVLDQLALYLERDIESRSKIKSALAYPAVILVMSIATTLVMTLFVLPRFVEFFDDLDSDLPLPTRMLLGLASFLGQWWWAFLLLGLAAVAGYILVGRTEEGMYQRHRFFLRLPLIGQIVEYSAIERFCRVIGAMMRAGVPLPDAMASAIESSNNRVYQRGLARARDAMIQGDGIAGPIAATGLFPASAVQMIRVGEESGTLDMQVESAAQFFSREIEYKLKRLTTLFEPTILLVMGVVVGFVAVALISAMYGVFQGRDGDL